MSKNLKIENNKKVFIAPYSSMTKTFKDYLTKKQNINFLGFIDSKKEGENIYKINNLSKDYDYIYIVSPNYGVDICKEYIKNGVKKNKIKIIDYEDEFIESSIFKLKTKNFINNISYTIQSFLYKRIKFFFTDKKGVMFIAPLFIDINIKDLYIYFYKRNKFDILIATNNKEQIKTFREAGFNVIFYPSISFVYNALKTKIKIMDHNPIRKEESLSLINSKTVQIWHGIALKKIGHLTDYKKIEYDLVVSTSNFVSEYSFGKLFKYKKMINSGYPRNDVLVSKEVDDKSLVLVNKEIYSFLKFLKKDIVVYMPTWRPDNSIKNPINLEKLDKFASKNNIFIVIKPHPFTREDSFYDSTFDSSNYKYKRNYSKDIMFYPITDDIYPILSISSVLITDYSSVYFDYLLVDKPIIFFVYDKEYYIKAHGDFMLDFDKNTPGEKAFSIKELENAILVSIKEDRYKKDRNILKDKLFEKQDGTSCQVLYDEVLSLSNQ